MSEETVLMSELLGNFGELKGPIVFYRNRVISTQITGGGKTVLLEIFKGS